jgi:hypothetical protein
MTSLSPSILSRSPRATIFKTEKFSQFSAGFQDSHRTADENVSLIQIAAFVRSSMEKF